MSSEPPAKVEGIDAGLPASASDWPTGVLERLKSVRQGDVLSSLPLLYLATPSAPVWDRTYDYADESGNVTPVLSAETQDPPFYMVTSQTCDIVESAGPRPNFPWIQAAPVFDMSSLNSGERKMLSRRGWRRWYWHLPSLENGFWVADLRIEVPVEKGVLSSVDVLWGHADEEDRHKLGERLATRRSRPAFSDAFGATIQAPLVAGLRELERNNGPLYQQMDPDVGVYVRMDSHLAPTRVQVALVCDGQITPDVKEWWMTWWDGARPTATSIGITLLPLSIYDSATMTVAEGRQFVELPLDQVSPY